MHARREGGGKEEDVDSAAVAEGRRAVDFVSPFLSEWISTSRFNCLSLSTIVGTRGVELAPNEALVKDPVLLSAAAQPWASYPGGHAEGYPDAMKQLFKAVYAAIRGDKDAQYPTFADGAEEQRIGEAIAASARTGQWVDVRR